MEFQHPELQSGSYFNVRNWTSQIRVIRNFVNRNISREEFWNLKKRNWALTTTMQDFSRRRFLPRFFVAYLVSDNRNSRDACVSLAAEDYCSVCETTDSIPTRLSLESQWVFSFVLCVTRKLRKEFHFARIPTPTISCFLLLNKYKENIRTLFHSLSFVSFNLPYISFFPLERKDFRSS